MYSTQRFTHQSPTEPCADTPPTSIITRLREQASNHPDSPAVCDANSRVSYAELLTSSTVLARRLRGAGVHRGDLVALCLLRSTDLAVGAAAILSTGACYVALDPTQPDERLNFMLADCGATTVVGLPSLTDRVSGSTVVVSPHECSTEGTGDIGIHAELDSAADDLAYVVYTSGSTGKPKGVMVEHGGLLNLIDWHRRAFRLTPADRTSMIANPGFDASAWEMWPTLCTGASLHVPPDELKTDPIRLRDWLVAERITVTFLPTPLAESLLGLSWPKRTALRYMLTGGDSLQRVPPPGLPFEVVNNYGVSEATVVSTSAKIDSSAGHRGTPTIGWPIDGVLLKVIGEEGVSAAPGEVGELVICGISVARGYIGQPLLTAQKFCTDEMDPSIRSYRTGDLVRMREDGAVDYLGRIDEQVQIRGFRVEVDEIAETLGNHPAVAKCTVVPVECADEPYLAAFVVARDVPDVDTGQLRRYLSRRLPDYMVPALVLSVTEFPTTANGKIDRRALIARIPDVPIVPVLPTADAEPRPLGTVEAALVEVVAERLKLPSVGVDDNFFLLGGHSMLGAQLIVHIARIYGVEMTLLDLFDHPTVAQMASEVERLLVEQIASMSDETLADAIDLERGVI